jgi:signal transduction histidine kinase/CheY-like chemotaxis protein/HPt (histidine-containing phosphotransfer) domain-containing protein
VPSAHDPDAFHTRLAEIHEEARSLLEHREVGSEVRAGLERLSRSVETLAALGAPAAAAPSSEEKARLEEILDTLFGLARLDFSRRARIVGQGPFDALAASANMLAEELDFALRNLSAAKAEAESATAAKSEFLAHMSHEIRTPLTAMLGFADLLGSPALSDSDRLNYALIIRRNGEHLLSVINDILDLSRVEAGKLAVERLDCSPARLLQDVAALMRVRAVERGLDFEVGLETPLPALVRTDPTRLRQVLLNLVSNAIKFTPRGRVRVSAALETGPVQLTFTVTDTGLGLTPEQLATLFRPFQQADPSMSRRFGGSGLGLAISRSLVEALGGTLTVESLANQGSTFWVRLPAEVPPGAPLVTSLQELPGPTDAAPVQDPGLLQGKVLLAEDGEDNQVLIATLLRRAGVTVAVVGSGDLALAQALTAAREGHPFDLVLMDMQMPVLDGYQATRRLRAEGYQGRVVGLTAHAMAGERERCLEAGCDDYLAKPLDPESFSALLRRSLPAAGPAPAAPEPLHSHLHADRDLAPILPRFVGGLPERMDRLRAAARAGAWEDLGRLVHQLRGAAGGYGFPSITQAAAAVEEALKAGAGRAQVERLLSELQALCARARDGSPRGG